MTMTSRDTIFSACAARFPRAAGRAAAGRRSLAARRTHAPAAMAERFGQELAAVHGEVIRCATMEEARRQLAELVDTSPAGPSLGAMDRPIVREATADLPPGLLAWAGVPTGSRGRWPSFRRA